MQTWGVFNDICTVFTSGDLLRDLICEFPCGFSKQVDNKAVLPSSCAVPPTSPLLFFSLPWQATATLISRLSAARPRDAAPETSPPRVTSIDLSWNSTGSRTAAAVASAASKGLEVVLLSETMKPGLGAGPGATAESATNIVR